MITVWLEGIGLCGPGLDDWAAAAPILAGLDPYEATPTRLPPAALLPPNERRRAVQTVRLALAAGAEAFAAAGRDPAAIATVFASSGGDGATIHDILATLASPDPAISPTRFHNSVHNTPAGYWSIATGSRAASTSLCAHDSSFAAGLLEAAVQADREREPVALIAYDVCYPAPLGEVRPIGAAFAVALVLAPILAPEPTPAAFARIGISPGPATGAETVFANPALEHLRRNTPAARGLPLLAAIARGAAETVTLACLDDMELALDIAPLAMRAPSAGTAG